MKPLISERARLILRILLVFGLLAVCILVPGFVFWQYQEDEWVAEKRSVIHAVALSRATQIAAWRAERLADAGVIARGARLQSLLRSPQNPGIRASASAWLDFVRKAYRYRSIAIIRKDGGRLLSVPAGQDDAAAPASPVPSFSASDPGCVMSNLYGQEGGQLISVAAAILNSSGKPVGTVIVEIPAASHLAPFLSEAVPGSRTVKTLLLTSAGNEVAVLGEQPPYSPVISAKTFSRADGVVTGVNKSGAPVLATWHSIASSSWRVAAMIEAAEVTGTRSVGAALLLGSVLLSLGMAAAAVRYGWQKDRMRYYQQLYRAEHERAAVAERYRSLNRMANDAILLLDLDLRIVEANDRALEMYGYTVEEITGLNARLLRPEAMRPLVDKFFAAVDEKGRRYETVHVRKDGTRFFVEGSVRLIRTESGEFLHTLLRDVTHNRQQQQTIERLNWLHRLNTLVGAAVLRSRSLEDLFQAVTNISLGDSGIRFAGVFMADGDDDIRLMAHAGIPEEAAARLHFQAGDASVTATAMRLGSTQVCSDVTEEYSEAFRDVARAIGCCSLASTPLAMGGRVVGALTLGSAETDFFQMPEQQLLEILGADLSYALDSIEREEQREVAVSALRESEMLFHSVADSVAALIWIDGPDHRYAYVNRQWSSFTGRPVREHLGTGWTEFLHPDDLPVMRDAYTRAAQQRAPLEVEYRLRRYDGVYRWVLDRGCPQFDSSGALTGYIGAAVDITERRERDAALRLSEEHQRLALNVAQAGTWELDVPTNAVIFSPRFKQLYGFSEDEQPDLAYLRSRIHEEDRTRVVQGVDSAIETAGEYEEEYRVVWPDSSIHWILCRGRVVVDEAGAVAKLVGVALDVTARVQTKERLEKAETAVRRIVATAHEGICEIDLGGAIRFATPRLAQLTGYRPSELISVRAEELIHPEDRATFVNCIRNARGPGGSCEVRLRRKDSEEVWVSVWLSPMDADAGSGDTKLAAMADITSRKRLEEQLLQASKMQALGQLAGGVAHDFNNLLTVSLGYGQLAAAAVGNHHPASEHIRQIIAASERGAALTRQLLVFSRHQIVQPQAIDLNKVVADLEKMLGRLIGENIAIRSRFSPHLPFVHADRGQIEQVIMNLVVNARDAMPNGGVIEIETASILSLDDSSAAQRQVHLRVRDTGVGMDSATRARIFEPFFTTKPKGRGTGLGLATVYGIVAQASGRIEVTSEPGRGTSFDIYLPVSATGVAVSSRSHQPPAPFGVETVLVIEDDPALRSLVEGALRQAGYTVLLAESGLAAFELASKYSGEIDLLLTDVLLPGMTGPEIIKVLDGVRPGLAVVLMSGYTGDFDLEDLLAGGAGYLQKPFSLPELNAAVRNALDGRVQKPAQKKIIIADDDPSIRELLRVILEEAGYTVSEAENGAELTRKLTSERFDVAITDIVMPEQDGIETLMSLRTAPVPVDTRVIVLSGGAGVYLQTAERMGAAATLTKPVSPARLLNTVEKVFAGTARAAMAAAGK